MVLGQAEVQWRLQTVLEKIGCLFGTLQTERNIDFSVSGVLPLAGRFCFAAESDVLQFCYIVEMGLMIAAAMLMLGCYCGLEMFAARLQ
ncbi:unnamed protein product [Ilex paraguariensis]|uniref:Uncharacterized protein n=1 Tax=Ilex paraguariensis TaxID=185542 RepID=A0ABC8TU46_9AQUA